MSLRVEFDTPMLVRRVPPRRPLLASAYFSNRFGPWWPWEGW